MKLNKINHYCNRLLQELSLKTGYSFSRPSGCIILLTNRCNARCVHCQSWKLPPEENELSTQEWKEVLKQMRDWLGPVFLSITGGETLLKKDAIDLAQYASDKGFWTEFLTNGLLMNRESASLLAQSKVKRIKISLDGSTAVIHDLIRGRDGFFEHATKALSMLVEEKRTSKSNVTLWAKTSIMSHNVRDLANITKLAKDLGVDGVEYQALEPVYYSEQLTNKHWYRDNPLWVNDPPEASRSIVELKKLKTEGFPIVNSLENLGMVNDYFHNPEKLAHKVHAHEYAKKKPQCRSWAGGLQIMPDGGLKMCHFMEPFAYARDGNIKKLWQNRVRCWKKECRYLDMY
jgi:MoaA/NifB/PqqE/SkfB family radical SAM enzyme